VMVGKTWDVAVVGAGPAGSTAARDLARRGIDVLVLEKCTLPRLKPCAGGLTPKAYRLLDFDLGPVVRARARTVELQARHHGRFTLTAPRAEIWMADRTQLDCLLAEEARRAGAHCHEGEPLLGLRLGSAVTLETARATYRARAVVGADGADSVVARLVGLRPRRESRYALALELEAEPAGPGLGDTAIVDFGLPHGYFWAFPKGDRCNVGVSAFRFDRDAFRGLRHQLDRMLAKHGLSFPSSPRLHGHKLPIWSGREPLDAGPVLLAGDAAGLVDPLFGEGIAFALRSGQLAADAIAARLSGKVESLDGYTRTVHATLGRDLDAMGKLAALVYWSPSLALGVLRAVRPFQTIAAQVISGERNLSKAWKRG